MMEETMQLLKDGVITPYAGAHTGRGEARLACRAYACRAYACRA